MKTIKCLLIILISLLYSCGIFKDAFVNNYDGAGYFKKLISYDKGNTVYIDSINHEEGFDAVIFMHIKMTYSVDPKLKPDEIKGYPELHFSLTDTFIKSDAEVKNEIYRRGILARWFKYYVYDNWNDLNNQKDKKYFDSYVMFEVKSKMNTVIIDNLYLRFWGDSWLKILINKNFKVEPNKINYLGTYSININKTDKYSGKTIQQTYTSYAPGIKEGYLYDLNQELKYNEADYRKDLEFLNENYPNTYNIFKDKIVYFQWE